MGADMVDLAIYCAHRIRALKLGNKAMVHRATILQNVSQDMGTRIFSPRKKNRF